MQSHFLTVLMAGQFVEFRKYAGKSLQELARDTLAEIPKQVVSYFVQKRLMPTAPRV